ncbi:MAG: phosphonate ABC transporter, permease protein PhnE [Cyanobacteria bacterium P01_A01_bin.3]
MTVKPPPLAPTSAPDSVSLLSDRLDAILKADRQRNQGIGILLRRGFWTAVLIAIFVASTRQAEVSLAEFLEGIPRLTRWVSELWPPDFTELPSFAVATWETLAIAIVGTLVAAVSALPLSLMVARNVTPAPWLGPPVRGVLNLLRGIDTAIFALFFVAVVGLGPFAGVLGVMCHTTGSMAKLYAEVLETLPAEPLEAMEATGTDRWRTIAFAVLPEALPALVGISLYLWEVNVRSSVILGIVGAGGIGYELSVSLKLLDFGRLTTLLILILVMVTAIDGISAWLRHRLK